ncbi:unnamed protein product [Laminaria digitata]
MQIMWLAPGNGSYCRSYRSGNISALKDLDHEAGIQWLICPTGGRFTPRAKYIPSSCWTIFTSGVSRSPLKPHFSPMREMTDCRKFYTSGLSRTRPKSSLTPTREVNAS